MNGDLFLIAAIGGLFLKSGHGRFQVQQQAMNEFIFGERVPEVEKEEKRKPVLVCLFVRADNTERN